MKAKKVSLVEEFNNWNSDSDPIKRDENGIWTKTKKLQYGDIEYKFCVDGEGTQNLENLRICPNCFGSQNSVVIVKSLYKGSNDSMFCGAGTLFLPEQNHQFVTFQN